MTSSASKKRSAPATEDSALTAAIKRRRRTDFGNSPMITRSQALSAARNAVLHTTELLENILYFLPMKDLLFAQRVCTKWRELIQRSVPLQEALFFRPRELGVYWRLMEQPGVPPQLVKVDEEEILLELPDKVFKAAIPNPLLCRIDLGGVNCAIKKYPETAWLKSRPSALYSEASWRKMLIAHASPCKFEYYVEYQVEYEDPDAQGRPYSLDGVLAGLVFPTEGMAGNVIGIAEEAEAGNRAVEDDGHVIFPHVMFTTEEQLEMGVLK
ncbi:hypothetical protein KC354_g16577 [Hortaea werneckii]|nr:hypothetical protein KC354_g16577 [Hortaea werneckii]